MLKIKNLKKSFGSLEVLKGISFDVKKGDVISIIGPSGCGKSTLLRCLNLLEKPDDGTILFHKVDITKNNINVSHVREKMGMVFQSFNLFPHLTVLENITLAPINLKIMSKGKSTSEALKLLESVGLLDKKDAYPSELSGGQKQRVAIVRTLMMDPDIILFDEPTSALDPEMVGEVLDLIKMVAEENKTMIIVSHEMNFVKSIATRILFLDNGKILFDGSNKEFFNNKNERIKMFLQKVEK